MRLRNNPCKTCTEHTAECHATCEAYRKAKEEHAEMMAQIRKEEHIREYMAQSAKKKKERYMKRK